MISVNGALHSNGINGNYSPKKPDVTQHRLDLVSEISALKVRLAAAENASRDWEAKYHSLQKNQTQQQIQLREKDLKISELQGRLLRQQQSSNADAAYELECLRRTFDSV